MFPDGTTGGALLVGSLPLRSSEEVFRTVAGSIGDRLRRMPDGETGPRSDWIVWQYPVLSSRPEFEVCPPGENPYRSLPRLRIRDGADVESLHFEGLGYADAARSSYRTFSLLKRDGVVPAHCRFQVCLPTPLAPISVFVTAEDQAVIEPIYERRMLDELEAILDDIPHDQLAVQWDTNFEFVILEGYLPTWFSDVRAGVVERLLRLARAVPADVQLGFHFCHSHEGRHQYRPHDANKLVEVANALTTGLGRTVDWLHLPVAHDIDVSFFETLGQLAVRPETELYLGLIHVDDGVVGAQARITTAKRYLQHEFGVATECGWGRNSPADVPALLEIHRELTAPVVAVSTEAPFAWPSGFVKVPDEEWTEAPVDEFGLAYDNVEQHGWYRNLDPTVAQLAAVLRDGDILVDYSGGTGILLDRLQLRVFDADTGTVVVDSSPKFLRVALEKFRDDDRVVLRLLRFLRDEGRLQRLDEVLGPELLARGVDVIVSTNAVHLYPDLADTAASWVRVAALGRPGPRQLGQHPQPARRAQPVDPRRDGMGGGRPGGRHRADDRRTAPTGTSSTTTIASPPTPPTVTGSSSSPAVSTSTCRPSRAAASWWRTWPRRASRPVSTTGSSSSRPTTTPCSAGWVAPSGSTGSRPRTPPSGTGCG